ncbi:unnamed protein product [Heligmosomoides polygyrus]|uniref:MarR family transcriptional regulator n=1 Tax=Heligmosomoides polygyrus TaxID=6339 RepID=A0A183FDE0_HELPZ|nr:unnamed protein product [Heligmosomoides polygyrus]
MWGGIVLEKDRGTVVREISFNLEDAPRSGRPTAMQDDDLKAFVDDDPSQTVREIVDGLGVSKTAATDDLKRFGKVKKLESGCPRSE